VNIKAHLRALLMNPEIISLTADKTVYFLHANNAAPPYIEYEIYDEDGEDWAENKEIATSYYIQVDIFSKGDYTELENVIKEKMIDAGFNRSMAADLYEKDTGLYHKAMRFIFTTKTN